MVAELQLGPDWRSTTDERNYCLSRRQTTEKARKAENVGREYWLVEGYWPTLEQVLGALVERNLLRGEWRTMPEAVQQIQRLRDDIRHAVLLVLPERPGGPVPGVQKQMTISA